MTSAPLPGNEYARLMALAQYEILDTLPEENFDRAVRLAAHLLGTSSAYINFVDQYRQWNKASSDGMRMNVPRADSMCAWTILQERTMVVADTREDPRFMHNPLVVGAPFVRMYAGARLVTPSGHSIGTLCVTDDQPRALSPRDLQALEDLAAMVMTELELRIGQRRLDRDLGAARRHNEELRRTLEQAQVLEGISGLTDLNLSPEEMTLAAAALLSDAVATDLTGLLLFEGDTLQVRAAHTHRRLTAEQCERQRELLGALPELPGALTWDRREASEPIYISAYAEQPGAVPEAVAAGVEQVAWVPLGTRGGVTSLLLALRLKDHPVSGWRRSDRALLEAAGRTIRSGLDLRVVSDLAHRQARQDPLTGALNRRAFDEDLLTRQTRPEPFCLAVLDLDGMKGINDKEGHRQGDKLLRVFVEALTGELPCGAALYRIGGDEFVVLLPTGEAALLDEYVDIAVMAARQVVAGAVGVSVGLADSAEGEGAALMDLADARMYAVKQRRKALRAGL